VQRATRQYPLKDFCKMSEFLIDSVASVAGGGR
jgi:hypothetical protein